MKPILDTDAIVKLWKRLGGAGKVTKHLAQAGVVNPATGAPFSKATIIRLLRRSGELEKLRAAA